MCRRWKSDVGDWLDRPTKRNGVVVTWRRGDSQSLLRDIELNIMQSSLYMILLIVPYQCCQIFSIIPSFLQIFSTIPQFRYKKGTCLQCKPHSQYWFGRYKCKYNIHYDRRQSILRRCVGKSEQQIIILAVKSLNFIPNQDFSLQKFSRLTPTSLASGKLQIGST